LPRGSAPLFFFGLHYNPVVSDPVKSQAPATVLTYSQAAMAVQEQCSLVRNEARRGQEMLPLLAAMGRVLAQPVTADRDQPPFRRSTRDGFAGRADELAADNSLHVTGQIRAGEPAGNIKLGPGQAVEIMTGAPVPEGADCVVMIEHVVYDPTGKSVRIAPGRVIHAGDNIVPTGAEARSGDVVLPAGLRLEPRHIAVAAASGNANLRVFSRPRVAVLATGDELVEVDEAPLGHQIRNSNSYSLAAQVAEAGGEPLRHDIVADRRDAIEAAIRESLDADLLLLSGGVSMGRYDFVEEVLLAMGAEFFFTGALIQPGRPVVFGRLPHAGGRRYFFGLPGNPVSTLVTFALFVEPLLAALAGRTASAPRFVQAELAKEVRVKSGLTRFLPAILNAELPPRVTAVGWQGSGDLAATATTNCYLVVPPDRDVLTVGETVSILLP
jgi:molybdopterin molybdotransferase